MSEKEEVKINNENAGCLSTVYKMLDVAVPITIEPSVILGDACVEMIDEPCIVRLPCRMKNNNCQYAIKQKLCVIFPIQFDADAKSGDPICCTKNTSCERKDNYEEEHYDDWIKGNTPQSGERKNNCDEEQYEPIFAISGKRRLRQRKYF